MIEVKEFCKMDLQALGEMAFMFEQVKKNGEIPIEQKNKAEFYERYCRTLQKRMILMMEAGQGDVLSSKI